MTCSPPVVSSSDHVPKIDPEITKCLTSHLKQDKVERGPIQTRNKKKKRESGVQVVPTELYVHVVC